MKAETFVHVALASFGLAAVACAFLLGRMLFG